MRVVLLRHAWAGDRDAWSGDDRLRPLDERGREQALALRALLRARGVTRVLSSPYVRCTQTVAPLELGVEIDDRLGESASLESSLELLRELDGAVVCTHGTVAENVLGRPLKKGAAVVLDDLQPVEEIPPP